MEGQLRSQSMQYVHKDFTVIELVRGISTGAIALPEFQRDFVWDPNQVIDLLESVANGWPIGSLLLLEGPQPFGIKEIANGPAIDPESVRYYLLDGQQRATSLFHVLSQTGDVTYYIDLGAGSEEDPPEFMWSRLSPEDLRSRNQWAHPVGALMDDRYLDMVLDTAPPALARQMRAIRDRRLGALLGDVYSIPSTAMGSEIELEALTRIFETLNRTGLRLDAFDLMVAVLYPVGFKLRDRWEQALVDFPQLTEFGVDGLEVLKVIALWRRDHDRQDPPSRPSRRVSGVRQGDVLNTPGSFVQAHWERAIEAYSAALSSLKGHGGVGSADGIPSEAQLLTLAYLHDAQAPADVMRKFYWLRVADQRYAQGANTQVIADVDWYTRIGEYVPAENWRPIAAAGLRDAIARNRILRRGLWGLAVRNGALDPLTGEVLRADQVSDVSLLSLLANTVASPARTPVYEMIAVNGSSLARLRRLARSGDLQQGLHLEALHSQGFRVGHPDDRVVFEPGWQDHRLEAALEWIKSEIS